MFPSTSWEKVLSFSRDPMFVESQIKVLIQDLLRIGLLRPNECHCCSTETVLTNTGFYSLQVTWELRGGEAQVMGCMLSHFSRVQLFATPWIVARQASLSMGILQARILEWVATPFSRGSSQLRDRTQVSHIAGGFFTIWANLDNRAIACTIGRSPVNSICFRLHQCVLYP